MSLAKGITHQMPTINLAVHIEARLSELHRLGYQLREKDGRIICPEQAADGSITGRSLLFVGRIGADPAYPSQWIPLLLAADSTFADYTLQENMARVLIDLWPISPPPDLRFAGMMRTLTGREKAVLAFLARGLMPEDIAARASRPVQSVMLDLRHICIVTGTKDITELRLFVRRHGFDATAEAGL